MSSVTDDDDDDDNDYDDDDDDDDDAVNMFVLFRKDALKSAYSVWEIIMTMWMFVQVLWKSNECNYDLLNHEHVKMRV